MIESIESILDDAMAAWERGEDVELRRLALVALRSGWPQEASALALVAVGGSLSEVHARIEELESSINVLARSQ